jgi:hypothetical protein
MKVALPTLTTLLQNNVLELRFKRRRPKPGDGPTRRMLCTNSRPILESSEGLSLLHYSPSTSNLKFNPSTKNLVVVWDIFMQDYRCVNANDCEVVSVITSEDFWPYYNTSLLQMSPSDKINFMNS